MWEFAHEQSPPQVLVTSLKDYLLVPAPQVSRFVGMHTLAVLASEP